MSLLSEIKARLAITGNYHDELLTAYANDVKEYLLSAGVKKEVVESKKAVGCIAKGVSDLWERETFSDLFRQRAIQLTFEVVDDVQPTE